MEIGPVGDLPTVAHYLARGVDAGRRHQALTLEEGDELTVYSKVRDGDVEWEGTLDFGPEKVEKIDWTEILRTTQHMDTKKWLQFSWREQLDRTELKEPENNGFGVELLDRVVRYELDAEPQIEFRPGGLSYEVEFPLVQE